MISGIGINTSNAPQHKKIASTSLKEHTKKIIKNLDIIKNIKNNYENMIHDLNTNNFAYVKNKYI